MREVRINRSTRRLVLTGLLLLLLVACAETTAVEDPPASRTAPALRPAPTDDGSTLATAAISALPVVPLATPTTGAAYPLTATPTPDQADPSIDASGQSPPSMPVVEETPLPAPGVIVDELANGSYGTVGSGQSDLTKGLDCETEIEAYQKHLTTNPTLATYEAQVVAACYLEQGDRQEAIEVYQLAVEDGADRLTEVALRQGLAELLGDGGDYPAALAQYEAILALAETEATRSQTLYQAGRIELLTGNLEAGYSRYLTLIQDYPAAGPSYQAMTALIDGGYAIDDFLQGLVAYEAGAYDVASAAFGRVVESSSEYTFDSYLYLARSLEKLGDVEQALAQLETFIAANEHGTDNASEQGGLDANAEEAKRGRIERAKMQVRTGRLQEAMKAYQSYLTLYAGDEQAPYAFWQTAVLAELLGQLSLARERYQAFAETYPDHRDAPEALFRSGYLSWRLDEIEQALVTWRQGVDDYPNQDYEAAAMLWLLKTSPEQEAMALADLATEISGQGYYAQRVQHVLNDVEPFTTAGVTNLAQDDLGQEYAESWLRDWLDLDEQWDVASLSDRLAGDARLIRGERLWQTGQRAEAARLFEALRMDHTADALASYQLALYFRDLGLHKSSFLAATTVMNLAGVGASGAPRFIARLAYPAAYADLIAAEAQTYGFDPLLQLALLREESYFDPWATSAAGAQGLSQMLPGTGATIASQLGWPGYQDGDLYRPDVAVAFGAYYLDQQLERYGGSAAAALSAYNAGPGFADQWYALEPDDMDLFLEAVDFPETQRFIKQIYSVHAIYRFLYS